MTCTKCHAPNDQKARFCRSCGSAIASLPPTVEFIEGAHVRETAPPSAYSFDPGARTVTAQDDEAVTFISKAVAAEIKNGGNDTGSNGQGSVHIGRVIEDKYRIDEKIGVGGMGAVYRAARLLIGDEVAIKILNPEHVSQPGARERFRREAQAAARIKNDNAVVIYDFGITSDGIVYLVMELLHGESLRALIKRSGPLEVHAVVEILNQVCNALEEAHRHQVVHRDLKPDNIIVRDTPLGVRVKVLDFGIAKLRDMPGNTMTQVGTVMGTPRYMSPEQCLGEEIDHRSDIYSLGIVLYEMLAGEVPFRKPTSTAVSLQQVSQPPPPLRDVNPAISFAVQAVVLQALQKQREARQQSASALASAFSAAVNAGWQPAVPPPPPARPFDGGGPVLTPTMVALPPSRMNIDLSPPRPAPSSAAPAGQNKVSIGLIVVGALGLLAIGALIAVLLVGAGGRSSDGGGSTTTNLTPGSPVARTTPTAPPATPTPSVELPTAPDPRPTASPPPDLGPSIPDINRDYYGTMGGQQVHMKLEKRGSRITGFAQTSKFDSLVGTVDNDGNFRLEGRPSGSDNVTGIYRGRLHRDGTISGAYWTYPNGTGSTPILGL